MKKTYEEEDDLKELLELEMLKEAQMLEDDLLSDEDLNELNISDDEIEESFGQLVQRLKDEGVYRVDDKPVVFEQRLVPESKNMVGSTEDTDNGSTNIENIDIANISDMYTEVVDVGESNNAIGFSGISEKTKWAAHKKKIQVGKVACFILVVLIPVFAVSMTSEGNRQYFIDWVHFLRGDDSAIVADNDEDIDWPAEANDEREVIHIIETELNVVIPEFYYIPKNLKYSSFFVDKEGGYAYIRYDNTENGTKVIFTIYNQTENVASLIFNVHGDKTIKLIDQDIEVSIRKIANNNSESEYDATWKYHDTIYKLKGRMSLEEFEKLLNGLQYTG